MGSTRSRSRGAATEGAFAAKLALVGRLVGAMAGGLSRDERPALDRALRATYEAAGIGPDPATPRPASRRPSPTSSSGSPRCRGGQAAGPPARALGDGLAGAHLSPADAALPLDRRLLVIGLAAIGDPEVRASPSSPRSALLWDAVRRDLEPKLVVVDEAWKVMRQPSGAEFVEELARSARHYHAGLQLATQDIVEFLRSDFGEAIVKQCDIRVLLGQTPEGVDALARYFDLTAAERRSLAPRPTRRGPPLRRAQPRRVRGPGQQARVRMAHHPSSRPGRPVPLGLRRSE